MMAAGDHDAPGVDGETGHHQHTSTPPGTAVTGGAVSRAGRNLPAAIAVGLGLGALLLAALLFWRHLFVAIVAVAVAVSTIELHRTLGRAAGVRLALAPLLAGGQAMIWLSWPFGTVGVLAAFAMTVVACLLWRFRGGADGYLRDTSASVFVAAYVPLFASFAALLVLSPDGAARTLAFLLAVVCSDTGGYVAGVLFGRHPMAPSISPKKSWEGFAGSLLAGLAAGVGSFVFLLDGSWWQGAVFGVALVVTATTGDLIESLVKRDVGVKDMGSLLPGHGGIMDRMDSLLPSAVVSWLLLTVFLPLA
ncbi:phosphatidate cytidylyltransferase [Actinoalloteichus spitiensis]|uniref:phosphatidate cytidylyltransferase n=1 Tax=Actinoalloteichus spitiensis TaxID=252394 RepID=UPI00036DA94A|nr:phosphatidate cytidylyltransferase [Actinoalloteichus spitiensis]